MVMFFCLCIAEQTSKLLILNTITESYRNEKRGYMALNVWFWQLIVSSHMAGLARAMAEQDCNVVFVAEKLMSDDRSRQGWAPPSIGKARLELTPTTDAMLALLNTAPFESIHICQGIRSNGLVGDAQRTIARRRLRQWIAMETVDDSGWCGLLKRLEYRRLFLRWRSHIEGVLAIGHRTAKWVTERGMHAKQVFPFAYFLPSLQGQPIQLANTSTGPFRFVFVGQFIARKRLALLISALAALNRKDFELVVVGSGPLENELRTFAEAALQNRVKWIGRLPMCEVQNVVAHCDCLVLPSRFDGWGAVVSEALMVGTPVICSDACGSADVVQASGVGGVFRAPITSELTSLLLHLLDSGRLEPKARADLALWAMKLGAEAGAEYLRAVLDCSAGHCQRPALPWLKEKNDEKISTCAVRNIPSIKHFF